MSGMQAQIAHKKYDDLQLKGAGFENARQGSGLDQRSLFELAMDVLQRGLLYEPVVWDTKIDGKATTIIVDGQRRYLAIGMIRERPKDFQAALKKAGIDKKVDPADWDTVPCKVVDGTLADADEVGLAGNIQREELSSFEIAVKLEELTKRGRDQKTLAARLGKSPAWVSMLLSAYRKATTPLRAAWKSGKLTDELVQEIAKLDAEAQRAAIDEAVGVRSSGRKVDKAASRAKIRARKAKKGTDEPKGQIGRRIIKSMVKMMSTVTPSDAYVKGALDAWDVVLGEMEMADVLDHAAFKAHQKKIDELKKAKEAKKAAKAAKAKKAA